jgi:hypothetical protein
MEIFENNMESFENKMEGSENKMVRGKQSPRHRSRIYTQNRKQAWRKGGRKLPDQANLKLQTGSSCQALKALLVSGQIS